MADEPLLTVRPACFTWLPVWIPALLVIGLITWQVYDGPLFDGSDDLILLFVLITLVAVPTAHLRYELWPDRLRVVHPFWHRDIELHRIVTAYETQPSQNLGPYSSNGLALELRKSNGGTKIETLWPRHGEELLTALMDLLHSFGFGTVLNDD